MVWIPLTPDYREIAAQRHRVFFCVWPGQNDCIIRETIDRLILLHPIHGVVQLEDGTTHLIQPDQTIVQLACKSRTLAIQYTHHGNRVDDFVSFPYGIIAPYRCCAQLVPSRFSMHAMVAIQVEIMHSIQISCWFQQVLPDIKCYDGIVFAYYRPETNSSVFILSQCNEIGAGLSIEPVSYLHICLLQRVLLKMGNEAVQWPSTPVEFQQRFCQFHQYIADTLGVMPTLPANETSQCITAE